MKPDFIKLLGLENKVHSFVNHLKGEPDIAILTKDIQISFEERCNVLYGKDHDDGYGMTWSEAKVTNDTHTAYIFGIEKIVKEPCRHEIITAVSNGPLKCKHCGKGLRIKIEEIEG